MKPAYFLMAAVACLGLLLILIGTQQPLYYQLLREIRDVLIEIRDKLP